MIAELFEHKKEVLLSCRFLPESFDEFVGQQHLLLKDSVLRTLIEEDKLFSLIFYGPPGTGKTALAKLIAKKTNSEVIQTNATIFGIPEIKELINTIKHYHGQKKFLLILDEIHHLNRHQQNVLLPEVEKGNIILIGITTENPFYYLNQALISRSFIAEFKKLSDEDIKTIIYRALTDKNKGLGNLNLTIDEDACEYIIHYADGDARKALNVLDLASTYLAKKGQKNINLDIIKKCVPQVSLKYDKSSDYHYDHISAFIKSIRGSDPDAALYWMEKMLMAGEDPRYIVRRLIILAAEDIGNADPFALVLATSALEAVEFVGMPEAEIILAEVVCYLACAEKSNASYEALQNVKKDMETQHIQEVPQHLKDSHRDGEAFGHGKGYLYPHDYEGSFVVQKYMEQEKYFYFPKDIGKEKEIKQRLEKWRQQKKRMGG
jgi:putative ATPase